MRCEISINEGRDVILIAQDLKKCYEYIRYHVLAARGVDHSFPVRLLRLTILSYSWERQLVGGNITTSGIVAWRGMIAGCVSATRELKCYLKTTLQGS